MFQFLVILSENTLFVNPVRSFRWWFTQGWVGDGVLICGDASFLCLHVTPSHLQPALRPNHSLLSAFLASNLNVSQFICLGKLMASLRMLSLPQTLFSACLTFRPFLRLMILCLTAVCSESLPEFYLCSSCDTMRTSILNQLYVVLPGGGLCLSFRWAITTHTPLPPPPRHEYLSYTGDLRWTNDGTFEPTGCTSDDSGASL